MSPQAVAGVAGVAVLALIALLLLQRHAPATRAERAPLVTRSPCTFTADPSTFAGAALAATGGQTICLKSGNYGTWSGTDQAITVTAARGATPRMAIDFTTDAEGFTLDHLSGLGGYIGAGASDITIENSTFTASPPYTGAEGLTGLLDIQGAVTGIFIKHDNFTYPYQSAPSGYNSKLFLNTEGASPGSAVTVENSSFANGDLDGIHFGGGSGDLIENNFFTNLCDRGVNHTDNIQFQSGTEINIIGNYIREARACPTQGITSYDGGTRGLLIEDNVVDVARNWGIELYSDEASIVRHNTLIWHPPSYAQFPNDGGTGQIDIDRKSQDPAGHGTKVYDNLTTDVDFSNGSTGSQYGNVSGERAEFVGPLDRYSGYALSSQSPVGIRAASDGSDAGARIKRTRPRQS